MVEVILILTTGTNGYIVSPYVNETKKLIEDLVQVLLKASPNSAVDWPEFISDKTSSQIDDDKTAIISFNPEYLEQELIVKCVYEIQVDRELDSMHEFLINPMYYQITQTQNTKDGLHISLWERIEDEIELDFDM